MSTLDELNAGPGGLAGLVNALSRRFRPVSRRDVLVGATVAATALATKPKEYALTPVAAYATICGPGNTAASGWTVFCATVNRGVNTCPPGSFAAGWWKAADSSWCGGGYRYIVDCNASCSKCTTGCSDNMCDSKCWSCSCGTGSSATCDQRRICCNAFRYGQCNTQIKCSGGVHCRVVSCVAPYKWEKCTTTSLSDNRTSEHSAPSLPLWSQIEQKYIALGAQASYLKASTGPLRKLGDNRGSYVRYQGGCIYYTTATRAVAVSEWVYAVYATVGGPSGVLGYPKADRVTTTNSGWVQVFEKGAITDSAATTTQVVWGVRWDVWQREGREGGRLGYPVGAKQDLADAAWIQRFERGAIVDSTATTTQSVWGVRWDVWQREGREGGHLGFPIGPKEDLANAAWIQRFQDGAIVDSTTTTTQSVWGVRWPVWQAAGRENGPLGFPTGPKEDIGNGAFVQRFQRGVITDSSATTTQVVAGVVDDAWAASGRWNGPLLFPTAAVTATSRGSVQTFQRGEIWALSGQAGHYVYGAVLAQWTAAGGASGSYGYPLTDTTPSGGGLTCTFEGGTITA